jgi:transcriptional regulator with XRE-family HTH domain
MARNQRLYDAIHRTGKRYEDVAAEVGADPKTVERWVTNGRLPHPPTRLQLSQILGVAEAVLWPDAPGVAYGTTELVDVYATRKELSPATVAALLDAAEHQVDILAYAAVWLWDTVPRFTDLLELKIAHETGVRICLGDPDSQAVLLRGREEGIGDALIGRCRLALSYAQSIRALEPNAIRLSDATLYASILRFDDDVLLNTHLLGNAAAESPVFHFRRERDNGIAANAIRTFERAWDAAQPLSDG